MRIIPIGVLSAALLCLSLPAAAAIRPEVAQDLNRAVTAARFGHYPNAMQQINLAEKLPGLSDEEIQAVMQARARIAAGVHDGGADCNSCKMAPNPVGIVGPDGVGTSEQGN